jgi:hypothetical protein
MKIQQMAVRSTPESLFQWLALALLVLVTQPVLGLLFLFLIPVWFIFAEVVIVPLAKERNTFRAPPFTELLVFSPRPPPTT